MNTRLFRSVRRAFTLVEIIVTLGVFVIFCGLALGVAVAVQTHGTRVEQRDILQQKYRTLARILYDMGSGADRFIIYNGAFDTTLAPAQTDVRTLSAKSFCCTTPPVPANSAGDMAVLVFSSPYYLAPVAAHTAAKPTLGVDYFPKTSPDAYNPPIARIIGIFRIPGKGGVDSLAVFDSDTDNWGQKFGPQADAYNPPVAGLQVRGAPPLLSLTSPVNLLPSADFCRSKCRVVAQIQGADGTTTPVPLFQYLNGNTALEASICLRSGSGTNLKVQNTYSLVMTPRN